MKCPYCEKEMTLGYIQCRDGVYWTLKKQLVASLSSLGKGSTCLSNGAADNSNTVFAFKCEDCKKIIIDYALNISADELLCDLVPSASHVTDDEISKRLEGLTPMQKKVALDLLDTYITNLPYLTKEE